MQYSLPQKRHSHCPMQGCNNVLFFEARKHKDLYLWMAKCPDGPNVKFHVLNGALTCQHAHAAADATHTSRRCHLQLCGSLL